MPASCYVSDRFGERIQWRPDPCSSSPATTITTTTNPYQQRHHYSDKPSECPPLLAKPHRGHSSVHSRTYHRDTMPHTVGGPLPTAARQGREQQKYTDNGARCVAGCIPIRYSSSTVHNTPSGAASARVLMITSRNGKGYVFPKGGWEVDESVEVAAQRETVEEAGVRGELELPMLGTFAFRSGKAERQNACALKGRCVAYMFAMRVSEELSVWPEAEQRHRAWCTVEEAYSRARYDWMRQALRAWVNRQGWADQLHLVDPPPKPSPEPSPVATNGSSLDALPELPQQLPGVYLFCLRILYTKIKSLTIEQQRRKNPG
ncbi:putative Nudix hydrolase 13, mitochondrial [Nannochloris sp. 'desiccata']|nr:putative Nudix hydrolase 13, mitochondrial [Chlorella desiccata (nom. nud.)]